jgi:acetyltransferase-like isoleucine patch superfamily enzyme
MIKYLKKLKRKLRLKRLRKKGVNIADDCQLTGKVNFGTEPYLITIKEKVTIANGAVLITHDGGSRIFRHNEEDELLINYGEIVIEENTFIGHSAIILPGVTIGPNSVVAAGAVVSKNVLPNSVYGGVPAKRICSIDDYYKSLKRKVPKYNKKAFKLDKQNEILKKLNLEN